MSSPLVREEESLSATAGYPEDDPEDDANLPPGRLHATRVPKRLSGSSSSSLSHLLPPPPPSDTAASPGSPTKASSSTTSHVLHIPVSLRTKLPSDGFRSRSRSPSLRMGERTPTTLDANSSVSSLDEDIFTDKLGLSETIDLQKEKAALHHGSFSTMPPVAERLSDETLDDCHAFSDVRSYSSRTSSAKGMDANGDVSIGLEPLNECDDETEDDLEVDDIIDDEESDGEVEREQHAQIILTNLDNLSLEQGRLRDGASEPLDLEP